VVGACHHDRPAGSRGRSHLLRVQPRLGSRGTFG
jgi:hypothetical protein